MVGSVCPISLGSSGRYWNQGVSVPKRILTDGKTSALMIIQQGHGPHNSIDRVFFSPVDEAVMFVKLSNGTSIVLANLSNLVAWRADGTISSDDELRTKRLRFKCDSLFH